MSRLRKTPADTATASWRWLIVLSAVGVWSHPLLDLLNTYGVRLLMPFSGRWFYGDALFIIDPWLWLALLVGIVASRLRRTTRPARVAIGAVSAYAIAMAATAGVGRAIVERQVSGDRAARVMVSPVPATPFRRLVVRDHGDRYETGELTLGASVRYRPVDEAASGRDTELAAVAARTPEGRAFLSWSRFPRFAVEPSESDEALVRISDMRYADVQGRGWASVVIRIPAGGLDTSESSSPERSRRSDAGSAP